MCTNKQTGNCHMQLQNDPLKFVDDVLEGSVMLNREIAFLTSNRIVVRRDHATAAMEGKVKLLVGSSAGHEPAFVNYIGKGMLTATVQGNIYQPPSIQEACRAIREIGSGHKPGVLVIINNRTAEKLTFATAVEKIRAENIVARLLVVGDDCFAPKENTVTRRGLSGIVLMIKIAGAMADKEMSLDSIYKLCEELAESHLFSCISSVNAAGDGDTCACTKHLSDQQSSLSFALGAGLQGEKSSRDVQVKTTTELVNIMLTHIMEAVEIRCALRVLSKKRLNADSPEISRAIVLVNNIGFFTPMEETVFTAETMRQINERGIVVDRIYSGIFLTANRMKGFSISMLLRSDPNILEYLDYPTSAPVWHYSISLEGFSPGVNLRIESVVEESAEVPVEHHGPKISFKLGKVWPTILTFMCDALISCEKQLNIIDSHSGDGDAGTNVRMLADTVKMELAMGNINMFYPYKTLKTISEVLNKKMSGTIVALYVICLEEVARIFETKSETESINAVDWMAGLDLAISAIQRYSDVKPGDKTMLDVLIDIHRAVTALPIQKQTSNQLEVLRIAAEAAENAVAETGGARSRTNRSEFEKDSMSVPPPGRSVVYPDPGAHIVGIWMRALYEGMKLKYPNL